MKNKQITLPAGKYYIGDASYVLSQSTFDSIGDVAPDTSFITTINGSNAFVLSPDSDYKDYYDNYGKEYWCDSGVMIVIPMDACDNDTDGRSCRYADFDSGIKITFDNNILVFDKYQIDFDFQPIFPIGETTDSGLFGGQ